MAKNLVIVESPAKAKTIEKFLGSDYQVESSYGHIADLPSKEIGVDVENGFKPKYEVSADKKALVTKLKGLAKKADMVWLASDEDREGEAISWHLSEELHLDKNKTKRIVFHEITKTAILKAIENPREIDYNLVNAQQARRVLDRLVGYELSPVLWRKIKGGLSAGRVQSVSVRLVVEREREHPVERIEGGAAPALIEAQHELGVGVVGRERDPLLLKLGSELRGVEDLPVEGDHERAVGAGHRLVATGEVKDGEPPAGQPDHQLGVVMDAAVVGPPVVQRPGQLLEQGGLMRPCDRCEPAHVDPA